MALDSYSALITTLQTWLQKADAAADAPDCIALFEAWANRKLRLPQMEQESYTPAQEYLTMPPDFLELRDIWWQGSPVVQLEYLTPQSADMSNPFGDSGTPRAYTIIGDRLRLIPVPDDSTTVRVDYWKRIPKLSVANPSNWLLNLYPDAYLYGSLTHGHVRMGDVQTANMISAAWNAIMQELETAGSCANVGSLLRIRVA